MIKVGKKMLITTNNWFIAPDGREYRSVFGTVTAIQNDEEGLGIKTNRNATNWYLQIGAMTIAGCQVFYAVETDSVAPGGLPDWAVTDGVVKEFKAPPRIFMADEAIQAGG